ncbi:MAG: 6,7-dimethyl-8-ribityllumazine synthase [Opitutales bacterium]|nr:6,7-dimethyl-8-ribityllumazine synthase [Opitutales bacterium]
MSLHSSSLQIDPAECANLKIVILAARFNPELVDGMLQLTVERLKEIGLPEENIIIQRIPGSAELPYASQQALKSGVFDVAIALGVLIAGETQHHDIVSRTASIGLQQVALELEKPVINGVISAETYAQAEDRTIGKIQRGIEFADAAVEMALWKIK